MSYSDDAVKAKLSALNESQESIVTVAQWIMFHRRHAERTAQLWFARLKESGAPKRLNLMYLANEVAQQSKARKREDFLDAFSPIMAEATAIAYKGSTSEVQNKLRRVVEVWRQRTIFENAIQEAIENRINDLDKSRSQGKKPLMGGSIFSSTSTLSAPVELQPLVAFQTDSTRLESAFNKIFPTVDQEYKAISNRDSGAPSPPVHAARLSALLKSLAQAEGAVHASLRAREALIESLEKLLDTNRQALERDQTHQVTLQAMRETVEATKRDVEDLIMRGLSTNANDSMSPAQVRPLNDDNTHLNAEPEPPQMEELTPPPAETILTPEIASYLPNLVAGYDLPQDLLMGDTQSNTESMSTPQTLMAGSDLLSSLSIPAIRSWSPHSGFANGTLKRRKLETEYSNFQGADAMADLDDDVAELLRQESSGHG